MDITEALVDLSTRIAHHGLLLFSKVEVANEVCDLWNGDDERGFVTEAEHILRVHRRVFVMMIGSDEYFIEFLNGHVMSNAMILYYSYSRSKDRMIHVIGLLVEHFNSNPWNLYKDVAVELDFDSVTKEILFAIKDEYGLDVPSLLNGLKDEETRAAILRYYEEEV